MSRIEASPPGKPLSRDTDFALEVVHLGLLREAPVSRRLGLSFSLTRSAVSASRRALTRRMEGASEREVLLAWVELNYGGELAGRVRAYLRQGLSR